MLVDGSRWGILLKYVVRPPDGLAQAFLLGEVLLAGEGCRLVPWLQRRRTSRFPSLLLDGGIGRIDRRLSFLVAVPGVLGCAIIREIRRCSVITDFP
jgi:hypothetical protein